MNVLFTCFFLACTVLIGECVKYKEYPYHVVNCSSDRNTEVTKCAYSYCNTATCQKMGLIGMCMADCSRRGCDCKKGYILDQLSGKCVKRSECPVIDIDCEINVKNGLAYWTECARLNQPSCKDMRQIGYRSDCSRRGCVCKEGYFLNTLTGDCVTEQFCNNLKNWY